MTEPGLDHSRTDAADDRTDRRIDAMRPTRCLPRRHGPTAPTRRAGRGGRLGRHRPTPPRMASVPRPAASTAWVAPGAESGARGRCCVMRRVIVVVAVPRRRARRTHLPRIAGRVEPRGTVRIRDRRLELRGDRRGDDLPGSATIHFVAYLEREIVPASHHLTVLAGWHERVATDRTTRGTCVYEDIRRASRPATTSSSSAGSESCPRRVRVTP